MQIEQGTCQGPVAEKFCGFEKQEWKGKWWVQAEVMPIL